jgi:CheY-like chemotaxis protein
MYQTSAPKLNVESAVRPPTGLWQVLDAVMTDIRLPGMSGIELARALVKDYPNLPVVIASGYGAMNIEFMLGETARTVLMLPKPYDLPALERTLAEAVTIGQRA